MSSQIDSTLKRILLEEETVPKEIIKKAETEAKTEKLSLGEILIKRNYISTDALSDILSKEFNLQLVNVLEVIIDREVFSRVPPHLMQHYKLIPYDLIDDELHIALADPFNIVALDDLKIVTGCRIRPSFGFEYQIKDRIETMLSQIEEGKDSDEEMSAIIDEVEDNLEFVSEEQGNVDELLKSINETPVIKITNKLLIESIKQGASDIFIEPWEKTMRIRCRVDGLLEELKSPPKSLASSLVSRIKVMAELDIAERRLPQDGRFKIKYQKREVDFRVSILPSSFGEKVCLRILDKTAQAQNIEKLGFHPDELVRIQACAEKPHGMILVTGPTGSGKTSTLYSILNYIDDPGKNITTVEDPVEYMMYGINQVNCKDSVGLSFSAALRSILRQDPDIVMIGEIRDFETMDIAIKAALTGHLVLSTLHTNDACSSIVRMVNMGIEPFLISSSVLMVSAQRLLRQLCHDCKKPLKDSKELTSKYKLDKLSKKITLYKPAGCSACRDTGYKGRTVITEVLLLSDQVKSLIMNDAPVENIKQAARAEGMTTLRESGLRKATEGITSLEEVLRVTAADTEETEPKG
ncbi:GspE/PulE family protein [Candidatus Omnitrophota bacterium]